MLQPPEGDGDPSSTNAVGPAPVTPRDRVLHDSHLLLELLSFLSPLTRITKAGVVCQHWREVATSPQSRDALVRHHWPHLLPFFHTDPNALFRLRVVHDEVPKMQRAREEAPLINAFNDASLTIELWHPEHELIAMGRVPLDGGARWAHIANRKHALQLQNAHPFPFSMEEWADCYLRVELGEGRWEELWHIVPHFQERRVEPSQPFFRATPGEERWQGRLSGIADLETQLPHWSVEDGLLEGGELVLSLTIDCAFPTSAYEPPLSGVEEEEVRSAEPLRVEAITVEFGSTQWGFRFPSRLAFLKALELSAWTVAQADEEEDEEEPWWDEEGDPEERKLRRLAAEFRQCFLVLEVLGANGRVVAFHVSDVVIEPTGEGQADEEGGGGAAYAMPALFLLQGAPLQWVAGAKPLTAAELATCAHRLLLLDTANATITTLSWGRGSAERKVDAGLTFGPYARAVWLLPEYCRIPQRLGGGMAARLALRSKNLPVQAAGEMRPAPFESVEAMLRCLKMCLLGYLDTFMDGKGEEEAG